MNNKSYEITGVMTYAHCFSFEVEAPNKKIAKEIAKKEAELRIDPAMAEHQTTLIDEPWII